MTEKLSIYKAVPPIQRELLSFWEALSLELPLNHSLPFGPPDSDQLKLVLNQTLNKCLTREDAAVFLAELDQKPRATIAVILNTQTGYANSASAVLFNLWVEPQFRQEGIGRKLVATAKDWAASKGAQSIQAGWHPENQCADRFWKQMGFKSYEVIGASPL